jgi:release factor glutamine methyltransferase
MNIAQALAEGLSFGLGRLDVQLLLLYALGRPNGDRAWLAAHDTDMLIAPTCERFLHFCERRARGEPLAYIVGHKEFFGLDLMVDARVLVPRPDTETLVEWALEVLGRHSPSTWVIDLGTGSGAIALAIKKHRPDAMVEAVDTSAEALEVAAANAKAHSLDVSFRRASWLAGTSLRYDLIASNPPYVAAGDPHLAALTHEPLQALAAGPDGLREIRAIVAQARTHLRPGGWLLLEHGFDQAAAVRDLLSAAGFRAVAGRRDLAGIERCSGGQWLELG